MKQPASTPAAARTALTTAAAVNPSVKAPGRKPLGDGPAEQRPEGHRHPAAASPARPAGVKS
ncbi:hypothetical protein [Amycolatopsis sp. NPDC051102]|uniref:hypothetical protein n=1 Tax=Amycolatopsis sp. NPDC051102 TaxID=3155163 RepID=UPI0034295797